MNPWVKRGGIAVATLLVILLILWQFRSETFNPWVPATVAYDSECSGDKCKPAGTVSLGHFGDVEFAIQPDVDDAVAQWGDCLDSLMACMEKDGTPGDCVDRSTCPQACKQKYHESTPGDVEYLAGLDAIESLFVKEGAACRATEEQIR